MSPKSSPAMSAKSVTTTLTCGHALTSNADGHSATSSPCSSPDSQRRFLNDTCALCDPEARRRQVKQEYDFCHAQFLYEYMEAKKSGDEEGMRRWADLMMQNTTNTRRRNYAVGRVRQDPDVQFNLDDSSDEMW